MLSVYTRQATIVAARSNYSIVNIEEISVCIFIWHVAILAFTLSLPFITQNPQLSPDLSPGHQDQHFKLPACVKLYFIKQWVWLLTSLQPPVRHMELDISAYREALRYLLNYTAAGIPAPSSIAESFWSSTDQLQTNSTYGILSQNFQSIIAFPFWFFNENNWGNTELKSNETIETLSPQFYTQASYVAPYTKLKFNPAMFLIFIISQSFILVFLCIIFTWVIFSAGLLPKTSAYPLFDIMAKSKVDKDIGIEEQTKTNREIIRTVQGTRLHLKNDWKVPQFPLRHGSDRWTWQDPIAYR